MVTADAVVINCPQGCVLQMAALPQRKSDFFCKITPLCFFSPISCPILNQLCSTFGSCSYVFFVLFFWNLMLFRVTPITVNLVRDKKRYDFF